MRRTLYLVLGIVMVLLGGAVALRPLLWPAWRITGTPLLDMLIAAFFLLRGVMNVRAGLRAAPRGGGPVR